MQQRAPVNKQNCEKEHETDDGGPYSHRRHRAAPEVPDVSDGRLHGKEQYRVPDEPPAEKGKDCMSGVHLRNTGSSEKEGGREWCHRIKKDEEPPLPAFLVEFFSEEFQILLFSSLED